MTVYVMLSLITHVKMVIPYVTEARWILLHYFASPKVADWALKELKACLPCHAVLWFVYMLIYGVFPQNLSQGVYHLFSEVLATSATFWLLIILAPVACVLPSYLWRQLRT